jgi:hypothetical protein
MARSVATSAFAPLQASIEVGILNGVAFSPIFTIVEGALLNISNFSTKCTKAQRLMHNPHVTLHKGLS